MRSDVTAIVTCMTDAERPFIREALQSVQDQTLPCEETIVVVLESNSWIDDIAADFPHMKGDAAATRMGRRVPAHRH